MADLSGCNILIVDSPTSSTFHLRSILISHGCKVHVVSSPAAGLMMAHRKRLHAAFVEYAAGEGAKQLCAVLAGMKIPIIYTAAGFVDPDAVVRSGMKSDGLYDSMASLSS